MSAAFLWALAATVAAGIQVFSQKVVAHEGRDAALNGVFGYGISAILATVVFLIFYAVPPAWPFVILVAGGAGIVHGIGSYLRILSLRHIDAVIYFPINKVIGPILVVIIGVVWMGEHISHLQYIGITLSLSVPLLLVSSSEKHRQRNLMLGLMLLVVSTILTAITSPLQKVALNSDSTLFFTMLASQVTGTIISLVLYTHMKREEGRYLSLHTRDIQLGVLNGVLQFVSFGSFLMAINLGLVSIVYVIHAHYILIPIILSVWWYKDHINTRKLVAIVVSSLAILLLGT